MRHTALLSGMTTNKRHADKVAEWTLALVANGHRPYCVLLSGGVLDTNAITTDGHNGPGCRACRKTWCWHCHGPGDVELCPAAEKPLDHKTSDV